jgi:signal transduction histidine kinase/CheY-like chemotaxis protein
MADGASQATPGAVILFVDDDEVNRHALSLFFREAGYVVLEAGTGHDAIALAHHQPEVVLLDINLPDILGFEVCRQLRAIPETKHACIIHLTGVHLDATDRMQGLEEGADAYFIKPIEPRELLAHIRAHTRIRAAEEACRHAAQEWRTTFDAISDAVCLLDTEGKILRCNRALCQLVSAEFAQILGESLEAVLCRGLGLQSPPLILSVPPMHSQQLKLGERWFQVTSDPIHDRQGTQTGTVRILQDVTHRVQLEEQVRQSSRLEAIGRLAAGVAHDFNNLLTAILGNTSLLLGVLPSGGEEHELATMVERAAWRAADLTRQLLGFSRQTFLWLEATDLGVLAAQIIDHIRSKLSSLDSPAIELQLLTDDHLWPIQADPGHLGHVLRQLCENALDAMPNGGQLALSIINVELTSDYLEQCAEGRVGEFVRVRVQDTGDGIDATVKNKIFDPFFTTKPMGKGIGLGLSMVHGIVKQHQGWIECESEPGQGARFDMYFPRSVETNGKSSHGEYHRAKVPVPEIP